MDTAWTWDLSSYCAKYSFLTEPRGVTMREVERIFQLDPEPPILGNLNDYILEAVQRHNLRWFSFFLHCYENRLNGRVRRFLLREGLDRYDPERFLYYKMGCVLAMLDCLRGYDPAQGADFLTYAHHFIGNALLTCRMQEEAGSFENVDEYKAVRGIAWLYNQSGQSKQEAIQKYAQKNSYTEETAAKFLALAKLNRSRVPFYQTVQDEDSEETGEDVSRDDHWDYAGILWNGIQAEAIRGAFEKLNYREQTLLEKRNAICIPNKEKVYDEYFKWLLKSKSYIKALQGTSDLVRDGQALRYANFAKVYLPEIPLEEQKAIADYINSEVARIDNALPTFQKKIKLLREYRTRLISDVVTGQIDVRDVVIPEYTPEDDTEIDVADTPDDTEEVAEDAE